MTTSIRTEARKYETIYENNSAIFLHMNQIKFKFLLNIGFYTAAKKRHAIKFFVVRGLEGGTEKYPKT